MIADRAHNEKSLVCGGTVSGRKQHFIPQSLLKGFAREGRGKPQVVVYTYDRGIFSPPTDGIGAERNFYSEFAVEGEGETLDDRITNYETPLAEVLLKLRELSDTEMADGRVVAEFVTHLIVRNDHFRKSISSAGRGMLDGLAGALSQESTAKKMLGFAGEAPSEMLSGELSKAWSENEALLRFVGLSEAQFRESMFNVLQANFATVQDEFLNPVAAHLSAATAKAPEIAANAQRKGLQDSLSPPKFVEWLEAFHWRVGRSTVSLVLPDCIAIAYDTQGEVAPLMLADKDAVTSILMPLSSRRLLIGFSGDHVEQPATLNQAFARCSWDFFVADERTDYLESLRSELRSQVNALVDGAINGTLDDLTSGGGPT